MWVLDLRGISNGSSPYLRVCPRKPRKTLNDQVDKRDPGIEPGIPRQPDFKGRTVRPLVGPAYKNYICNINLES